MNDAPIPSPWPWFYDRVIVHWRSSVTALCGVAALAIPVLQKQGIHGNWIEIAGALTIAVSGALSKDN